MNPHRASSCLALSLALWCSGFAASTRADEPAPQAELASPWNLEELNKPPAVEWVAQDGAVHSLFYEGESYQGRATRVFAYYATPGTLAGDRTLDQSLPAVVLLHGGGGTAFREWVELWAKRGYAAIAMDLAGHRPHEDANQHQAENRTRLTDGGPDQGDDEKFGSVDLSPSEQWPYHAVAAAIRAHSLLRSFAEVDANRTAVTGISWGGYLTCIVAGVDPRFHAAVPVYGCGFLYENSVWLDRFANMSAEQRERWITLWDPSRYLPGVSTPILFVNGTNDFAYPLDSYMKSYQLVPGEKQLCITVNMPHSHTDGWAPKEIGLFVDQQLNHGAPLPKLGDTRVENGTVHLSFESTTKIASAALHHTTSDLPINQRAWESTAAEIHSNEITVAAPPDDTTAWFLTITDERGAVVSSPVTISTAK